TGDEVSSWKKWMQVFDLDSYLPVGRIALPFTFESTGSLIRWGADGLAYRINTNQVVLLRTSLLPSDPAADLSVRQEFVAAGQSNSSPAVLRCLVENHGPYQAQDVVLDIALEGATQIGTVTTATGTAQTSTNDVVAHLGAQPAFTTSILTI